MYLHPQIALLVAFATFIAAGSIGSSISSPNLFIAQPSINLTSPALPINLTTLSLSSNNILSDRVSFVDTIYAAVRSTTSDYPRALFREVQAQSVTGPTTDPNILVDVRLIFSITQGSYHSLYVDMTTTWGQWGTPFFTNINPSEDNGVLPSSLGMDITEADQLIKAAGFGQEYEAVDIRWPNPFPAEWQEVLYYFLMDGESPSVVTVGATDRKVRAIYDSLDGSAPE